ncbi:hypothetical protein D9M68_500780 [compost metagenome]
MISPHVADQGLYFVNDGLLQRYTKQLGSPCTRQLYQPGDFIIQSGLFIDQPVDEYISCITDVQLLHIHYRQLELFFMEFPEAVKLLLGIMQLLYLKEFRHSQLLYLELAIDRFRLATKMYGAYFYHVPRPVLASYLGISKKHLGRLFAELAHQKVLD